MNLICWGIILILLHCLFHWIIFCLFWNAAITSVGLRFYRYSTLIIIEQWRFFSVWNSLCHDHPCIWSSSRTRKIYTYCPLFRNGVVTTCLTIEVYHSRSFYTKAFHSWPGMPRMHRITLCVCIKMLPNKKTFFWFINK